MDKSGWSNTAAAHEVERLRQELAAERKRREEADQDAQRECDARLGAIARAEQADGQQRSDVAKMQEWRGRAERAEAANATLLGTMGNIATVCETKDLRTVSKGAYAVKEQRKVIEQVHAQALAAYKEQHPGAALLERMRALESFTQGFAEMAGNAIAHHTRPKTGMQVPYHDDFANLPPSGVASLERWWKAAVEALKPKTK